MLSQPRPAPKPVSEPPLSRLSHFVYNAGGTTTGGGDGDDRGDAAGQERQGTLGKEGGGVLARAVSDFGGTGGMETGFLCSLSHTSSAKPGKWLERCN